MLNCAALIVGCWMCRHDSRALFLLFVVGVSVFAPINPDWFSPTGWYSVLVMMELSVVSSAVWSDTDASLGIIFASAALIACHLIEMATTPYSGQHSAYPETVKGIEFAELILLSLTKINKKGVYNGIGTN